MVQKTALIRVAAMVLPRADRLEGRMVQMSVVTMAAYLAGKSV